MMPLLRRLSRRQWLTLLVSLLVTAGVLHLLLSREVLAALRAAFAAAALPPLLAAFGLAFVTQYLRAWRFGLLVQQRRSWPSRGMLVIALRLNLFNYLLPFRLGEASFPLMLREHFGVDLLHGTGILLVARLYDLCLVGVLLCAALVATPLASRIPGGAPLALGAALLLLGMPLLLLAGSRGIARAVTVRWPGVRTLRAVATGLDELHRQHTGVATLLLSIGIWLGTGLLSVACAMALSGAVGVAQALVGAAAHSLTMVIPVNGIAGIGPGPAAWAALASAAGAAWVDAVAAALLLQLVALAAALLYGLPALLVRLR